MPKMKSDRKQWENIELENNSDFIRCYRRIETRRLQNEEKEK